MNVEIGAEAALFPEKEYIKGIFVAVYRTFGFPLFPGHSGSISLSDLAKRIQIQNTAKYDWAKLGVLLVREPRTGNW
jgi:hypothetical protein